MFDKGGMGEQFVEAPKMLEVAVNGHTYQVNEETHAHIEDMKKSYLDNQAEIGEVQEEHLQHIEDKIERYLQNQEEVKKIDKAAGADAITNETYNPFAH